MFELVDRCVRLQPKNYRRNQIEPLKDLILELEKDEKPYRTNLTTLIDILQMALISIDRKTLWKTNDEKTHQQTNAQWFCRYFICLCRFGPNDRYKHLFSQVFQWLREVRQFRRRDEELHWRIFQLIEEFATISSDENEIVKEFFLVEPQRENRTRFCSRRIRNSRSICVLDYSVDLLMRHDDSPSLLHQISKVFLRFASNRRFTNYLIFHTEFYRFYLEPLFNGERSNFFVQQLIDELARSQTDSTDRVFLYTNFLRFIGEIVENVDLPIVSFVPTLKNLFDALSDCGSTISMLFLLKTFRQFCQKNDSIDFIREFHRSGLTKVFLDFLSKFVEQKTFSSLQIEILLSSLSILDEFVRVDRENLAKEKICDEILKKLSFCESSDVRNLSNLILNELDPHPIERSTSIHSSHIMFSYNHDSKDLVVQICDSLRQQGFRIWLDLDEMRGETLETMAQAIERASLVVICLTEKYKESANCQSEAQYAYRLNKPILPLVFQSKYKPTGWLGMIVGTKFYIDFTKRNFDVNMTKLVEQVQTMIS